MYNLLKQFNIDGGAGCNWSHGWSSTDY